MMIPTQLYIEPNQEKRIMTAFRKRKGCRINVRKGAARGNFHPGEMLLTPSQWMKYQAAANEKKNRSSISTRASGEEYET